MNTMKKKSIIYQVQHHVYYVDLLLNLNLKVKRNQVQYHVSVRNVKVKYND